MSVPARQILTTNLISMLAAQTGKPCGDGKAPLDVSAPYSVVHVIGVATTWGPGLVAPDDSADIIYQVDSVGERRDQAEWLADKVRTAVLGRDSAGAFSTAITPPAGLVVYDRRPDGGAGGVEVEGAAPHDVFTLADRYVIGLTPA